MDFFIILIIIYIVFIIFFGEDKELKKNNQEVYKIYSEFKNKINIEKNIFKDYISKFRDDIDEKKIKYGYKKIFTLENYYSKICKKCGASLIKKTGAYGSFWGCSNYPRCTYTRNKF